MLNIKQAQASSAIQQAFAGNKSAVQVRRPKKDEYLFLGEETLDLMVIAKKRCKWAKCMPPKATT